MTATVSDAVDVALHVEIQDFYARQSRALDRLDVDGFAAFVAKDGVMTHAHRGETVVGRAAIVAHGKHTAQRFRDVQVRHWFHQFVVDPVSADRIEVSYYTLVSAVDAAGKISFQPTFLAEDVLARDAGGRLRVLSRVIHQDQP
jgi:actinorhodin biosynthesis protein ActVIA